MLGFRLSAQRPPEARRINEAVIMRLEHVYEINPAKMGIVAQDEMPVWDTERIVAHRWDHLDWMHDHWADHVLGAEELGEAAPQAPSGGGDRNEE